MKSAFKILFLWITKSFSINIDAKNDNRYKFLAKI